MTFPLATSGMHIINAKKSSLFSPGTAGRKGFNTVIEFMLFFPFPVDAPHSREK